MGKSVQKDVLISQGVSKLALEKNAQWRIYNLWGSADIIMEIRSRWIRKARRDARVGAGKCIQNLGEVRCGLILNTVNRNRY